jgi:hypothetical protein
LIARGSEAFERPGLGGEREPDGLFGFLSGNETKLPEGLDDSRQVLGGRIGDKKEAGGTRGVSASAHGLDQRAGEPDDAVDLLDGLRFQGFSSLWPSGLGLPSLSAAGCRARLEGLWQRPRSGKTQGLLAAPLPSEDLPKDAGTAGTAT